MERQLFINKLKHMKLIAHRLGYQMTNYPENSLETVKYIFENKDLLNTCDGFEFDICFTKDHIPVVIHDKYLDDISDNHGLIEDYTLEQLKKMNFKFRKSLNYNKNSLSYKIITLKEILTFFENNIALLKNRIIKIETKNYIFTTKKNLNTKSLTELANIINEFPSLHKNIIHLSYWPLNLLILKKIQRKNNYKLIKNDLLCDYNIIVLLTKIIPNLDNISLRIKASNSTKNYNKNSKKVNKKIEHDLFWMKLSNALKEKNLNYAINKYGSVNIYVLNNYNEINEFCNHISDDFFNSNFQNISITTNNPIYLKKIKINNQTR